MADPVAPLPPGAVIGILGGGQLGRMLAMAAARLGLRARVLDPGADPPAAQVAPHVRARFDDEPALRAFAAGVDAITYEFENIPLPALALLEGLRPLRPSSRSLETSRDRFEEKRFLEALGLAVAPFAPVDGLPDLTMALARLGAPAILKTRRLGYDGKGQTRLASPDDVPAAWAALGGAASILEAVVPFTREVSVIAARGPGGEVAAYDPGENLHEGGILRRTRVPARLSPGLRSDAVLIAARILSALDHVGVLGVELFVVPGDGQSEVLVVNEIAPRVHNSGHWTQAGCAVDQFEQHVRAVAGWPLGDGARHADVEMINLIGDPGPELERHLRAPLTSVHLYGKAEARPGRKMGHVNRILKPAAGRG